ncbi:MAG: hypothetical protein QM784_19795 [Polyangiaceae bacterium]
MPRVVRQWQVPDPVEIAATIEPMLEQSESASSMTFFVVAGKGQRRTTSSRSSETGKAILGQNGHLELVL